MHTAGSKLCIQRGLCCVVHAQMQSQTYTPMHVRALQRLSTLISELLDRQQRLLRQVCRGRAAGQ